MNPRLTSINRIKAPSLPNAQKWMIVLASFGLFSGPLRAQTPEIDSLKALLEHSLPDTTRMDVLIKLGQGLQRSDPQAGVACHEQARQMAQRLGDTGRLALALNNLGSCYYDLGDLRQAETSWKAALDIVRSTKDTLRMGSLYSNFGMLYETRGDLDQATRAYEEALRLFSRQGTPFALAVTRNNLGLVFEKQGNYARAVEYFLLALADFETEGSDRGISAVLPNIGMVFFKQKAYDEAARYYHRGLAIKTRINDRVGIAGVYNNLGSLYATTARLDSAVFYHEKSLAIKQELGDQLGICASYNNLGIAAYRQGEYARARDFQRQAYQLARQTGSRSDLARSAADLGQACLRLGQDALAEQYLLEAMRLSRQVGERENLLKVYQSLAELYTSRREIRAVDFFEKYVALNDSLRNDEQTREITRLELQYQFDKEKEVLALERAREESLLQARLQRQRLTRNASLGGLAAGMVILLLLGRGYRQKQRSNRLLETQNSTIQRALEERETLLKEIHHRVKNNLQVISSLLSLQARQIDDPRALVAIQEGRNRVNAMALIHKNLYQDDTLVGVDAIDYIDKLTDSLFASYNINPEGIAIEKDIDPLTLDVDTVIPLGLILNELISNSLKYAFSDGRAGLIRMALKREPEGLSLRISDNGRGLPPDFDLDALKSLGFRLVRAFTQKLEGILKVSSDKGTNVEILIPHYKAI